MEVFFNVTKINYSLKKGGWGGEGNGKIPIRVKAVEAYVHFNIYGFA
jgi:hypothetical protein